MSVLDAFHLLKKNNNYDYISMDTLDALLIKESFSVAEKNELCENIMQYNIGLYEKKIKEYDEILHGEVLKTKKQISINSHSDKAKKDSFIIDERVPFYFDNIITFTIEQGIDTLFKMLPSKKIQGFHSLMNRLILEAMKETIVYEELLRESSIEEREYLTMELNRFDFIIASLKEYRDTPEAISADDVQAEKKNWIIFSKTDFGNACFINDIEKMDREIYSSFYELVTSIRNNTFKNVAKYSLSSVHSYYKVRDIKTGARIIFTRYATGVYVLLAAFVKKTNWDSLNQNILYHAVSTYENYLPSLKEVYSAKFLASEEADYQYLKQKLTFKDKEMKNNGRTI